MRSLAYHSTCQNSHYRGSRRREGEGYRNVFEEVAPNIPNLKKEKDIQVWEAQRFPNKMNQNRATGKYILIEMPKVKNKKRIIKAAREKQRVMSREYP